jgi:hypothetical protein
MRMQHTAVSLALAVAATCVGLVASADEGKIHLRVKVGDVAESQLTVVDGHQAQIKSPNLNLMIVPTVSKDSVMLSLTLVDADNKTIGTPRLKGAFGEQMKLVLQPESGSPLTVLLTAERLD